MNIRHSSRYRCVPRCSPVARSKIPPAGAGHHCRSRPARKIPGRWSGRHRRGEVVPDWIRTFGDPELTALVEDAVVRNPDLRAAAARVEASRHAVRVAASSLYPRIGAKVLGDRQGQEIRRRPRSRHRSAGLGGIPGVGDERRQRRATEAWIHHRSAGSMASASARRGRPMCGDASARKRPPRRPKATRSKPTTNSPGSRSPPRWRAPISRPSKPRSRPRTPQETLELLRGISEAHRRAQRAGPRERLRPRADQVPHRRRAGRALHRRKPRGRRPSAPSKLSPATIPPASSRRAAPFPGSPAPCPPACPRSSSNAGPTSSPPNAASPPPFIA